MSFPINQALATHERLFWERPPIIKCIKYPSKNHDILNMMVLPIWCFETLCKIPILRRKTLNTKSWVLRLCAAQGIWQRQLASTKMCRGSGDRGGRCWRSVVIHVDPSYKFRISRISWFPTKIDDIYIYTHVDMIYCVYLYIYIYFISTKIGVYIYIIIFVYSIYINLYEICNSIYIYIHAIYSIQQANVFLHPFCFLRCLVCLTWSFQPLFLKRLRWLPWATRRWRGRSVRGWRGMSHCPRFFKERMSTHIKNE